MNPKYCTDSSYGTVDKKTQLDLSDDAARVNWGGSWRMPTLEECYALLNCTSEWTTINGVNVCKFTGPNGASIFLVRSGCRNNSKLLDYPELFWSSTLSSGTSDYAFDLRSSPLISSRWACRQRYMGLPVRPVVSDYLDVYPVSLSFPCEGSSAVFKITTDQDYTISVSDSWITATISKDKKTVTVAATANMGAARTATITFRGGDLTQTVTVAQETYVYSTTGFCPDSKHPHFIDLGLSVKWACCNVGASSPEGYGGHYAWGETEEKTSYDWSTYKWGDGSNWMLTKYCTDSSCGTVDNKTQLDLSDDVARVEWGGSWVMPSKKQQEELIFNCTYEWTTLNGVYGAKFTSKINGESIFLPAAGFNDEWELGNQGICGYYWSSSLGTSEDTTTALYLIFRSSSLWQGYWGRYYGQSVRSVLSN